MRRAGFTMLELLLAVLLLGIMTTVAIVTYRAVTTGWRVSRDYVDRLERTDYALDQLVSGLRSAYYPHGGKQNADYGFQLTDNGDGESPDDSDIIEWTKVGSALVGGNAAGDAVHRIQVRVLEEGDTTWGERIDRTGLYARIRPLATVIPESSATSDDEDFTFANEELYRPILVAKGIEGFNCRVQAEAPDSSSVTSDRATEDADLYEDVFESSNAVPYKVQMTFYVLKEDPDYASRKTRVPILRTVRLPIHEQSLDGAALPSETSSSDKKGGTK